MRKYQAYMKFFHSLPCSITEYGENHHQKAYLSHAEIEEATHCLSSSGNCFQDAPSTKGEDSGVTAPGSQDEDAREDDDTFCSTLDIPCVDDDDVLGTFLIWSLASSSSSMTSPDERTFHISVKERLTRRFSVSSAVLLLTGVTTTSTDSRNEGCTA